MTSRVLALLFIGSIVVGALAVEAAGQATASEVDAGSSPAAAPIVVTVPAPAAAAPPTVVRGFDPDGWVKVIGALVVLAGAIGAIVAGWATVTGNRRAEARDLAAAARDERARAAAELRAEQLRAVATSTGATMIPTPPPAPVDPPAG